MAGGQRRLRILLVDDEPDILLLLQAMLPATTWEVVGRAPDGDTALRIAGQIEPDIAVVDYMMPGMDGFEVAAELKRLHPGTCVVLFSAYDIDAEARESPNVDRFLSKTSIGELPTVLADVARERDDIADAD
jgi:two-component system, response regulator PdtaR